MGEPEVEVTLHNVGNQLSVASALRVEIQDVAALKRCYSAGVSGQSVLSHTYLLRLKLSLLHDASEKPLSLGEVVMALPAVPKGEGFYLMPRLLTPAYRAIHAREERATKFSFYKVLTPCWQANGESLKRMLDLAGQRSAGLQKAATEAVIPRRDGPPG